MSNGLVVGSFTIRAYHLDRVNRLERSGDFHGRACEILLFCFSGGLQSLYHQRDAAMRARRILIVDDDADLRRLFRMTLTVAGYDVEEASDGVDALQLIDNRPPDLVVLD